MGHIRSKPGRASLFALPAGDDVPPERASPKEDSPTGSPSAEHALLGLRHTTTQILQFGELNDQIFMSLTQNSRRIHVSTYSLLKITDDRLAKFALAKMPIHFADQHSTVLQWELKPLLVEKRLSA